MTGTFLIKNTAFDDAGTPVQRADNSFTIGPGELDGPGGVTRNTDLHLNGFGTVNWGDDVNQNFLRLLENNAVLPKNPLGVPILPQDETDLGLGNGITNPVPGQTWFNLDNSTIYTYSVSGFWIPIGSTLTGVLDMGGFNIINLADPRDLPTVLPGSIVNPQDAVTVNWADLRYVDNISAESIAGNKTFTDTAIFTDNSSILINPSVGDGRISFGGDVDDFLGFNNAANDRFQFILGGSEVLSVSAVSVNGAIGAVGIGQTVPLAKLHIANPSTVSNNEIIRLEAAATGTAGLGFYEGLSQRGNIVYDTNSNTLDLSSNSGAINFITGGAGLPRIRIAPTGEVGIGENFGAIPATATVHIRDSTNEQLILQHANPVGSPGLSFYQTTTLRSTIRHQDINDTLTLSSLAGNVSVVAGGTERILAESAETTTIFGTLRADEYLGSPGDGRIEFGNNGLHAIAVNQSIGTMDFAIDDGGFSIKMRVRPADVSLFNPINMLNNRIINVPPPLSGLDAVNRDYVDGVAGVGGLSLIGDSSLPVSPNVTPDTIFFPLDGTTRTYLVFAHGRSQDFGTGFSVLERARVLNQVGIQIAETADIGLPDWGGGTHSLTAILHVVIDPLTGGGIGHTVFLGSIPAEHLIVYEII